VSAQYLSRFVLRTENVPCLRSRRGWDMTELFPELASFPVVGTFDGELVAFDNSGAPDFSLVCERLLNRSRHIQLTYVIFDVLRRAVRASRVGTAAPTLLKRGSRFRLPAEVALTARSARAVPLLEMPLEACIKRPVESPNLFLCWLIPGLNCAD
jgi:hypothetical protein